MYQMLKLKLGPQDIRGTVAQERSTVAYNSGSNNNHHQHYLTDFDKSARKHLLVNLVLQGKRFLVVVIFKATARTEKKNSILKGQLKPVNECNIGSSPGNMNLRGEHIDFMSTTIRHFPKFQKSST